MDRGAFAEDEAARAMAMPGTRAGGERRRAPRLGVLKRAKIVAGDAIFDCVVLNSGERGARVRVAQPVVPPERVELHFAGGGVFPARRRWVRGLEIGLEFVGEATLRREAAELAWVAYEALRDGRLQEAMQRLCAVRFFDDEALREAAEAAEAACARLEALLRERAQRRHP
ncbi:hypothetical protein GCM10010964_10950 [Caldovatus sediminis]|uniref:PilZ domain-containing protein n=2 Tax=Caldovatus sediminis TaxID=2041189 RepID=A0A8J2Z9A8_9PROT|nr:hypothetical protein GCM10010964_10950 [Caldovatus sediminis]